MKPFRELQVVEIAGSQAGAFTAKLFADYGASVVRVEPPGGDPLRPNGEPWGPVGTEFAFLNTSKQSVCLDLASGAGLPELGRLLGRADLVVESSAPGPLCPVTATLGGSHLVRAYLSPFGLSGPYAGYRSNVFTDDAIGGHLGLSGEPDREPLRRAGLHTRFQAGIHGFIGAMAALLAREQLGRGQTVEVAHFEGMAALHQHTISMWTHGGHLLRREGNAQPGPWHPGGVYPCKDGHVFLGHATGAKLIPFVDVLGYGHLFEDPRFATDGARGANKRAFDEALQPRLMELTLAEILDLGRAVFSPIGPVPTMLEVLEDEQYQARGFWTPLSGEPPAKIPRGPFVIEGHHPAPRPAPEPGAQMAEDVLSRWKAPAPPAMATAHLPGGPLHGVRVLDLTRIWSGPIAGRLLADLGADVIHVESPWNRGLTVRDESMATLSHLYPDDDPGERPWNRSGGFNKLARNKRSVVLNIQDERGRAVFAELVKHADVVLENYSPRVMPGLGFDFASLAVLNPAIVYTSISGYGATGPGQNRVALGPVIEAAVGLTSIMGYAGSGPYRSGVAWADPVAGMCAVAGTIVGLWDRAAAGGAAQRVEVAMAEAMATFVGEELLAAQVRGSDAVRIGNRDRHHAPQGVYRSAGQDRWVAISVTSDVEWRALCQVMALDPAFATLPLTGRHQRHDDIDSAISAWTQARSPRSATERLQAHGVIAAQVSDGCDLAEDPQLEACGFWAEMDHADVGRRRYPGSPIRFSETPSAYRLPPPRFGEHNREVYSGLLGMAPEALAELLAARVIVNQPPAGPEEIAPLPAPAEALWRPQQA
jgi:crotonobetainyl-CoA:carnitine CoA-transferase CaiB-like acyl-CoA transferase